MTVNETIKPENADFFYVVTNKEKDKPVICRTKYLGSSPKGKVLYFSSGDRRMSFAFNATHKPVKSRIKALRDYQITEGQNGMYGYSWFSPKKAKRIIARILIAEKMIRDIVKKTKPGDVIP